MSDWFISISQDQALWILTGVVVPVVVAVFTKVSSPSWVKGLLATVLSAVNGAIVAYFTVGVITPENWVVFFAATVAIAQGFYGMVFKPLGWSSFLLENIGLKDSPEV
jgi:glucan phosphoethanolaminetransferase (alkaline phosphatase superfamily)